MDHHNHCTAGWECKDCAAADLAESLTTAIRRISHGGVDGPTGLEMLTMSIMGDRRDWDNNLSSAIRSAGETIADALNNVADAIREAK
jgi:hypothetical protein